MAIATRVFDVLVTEHGRLLNDYRALSIEWQAIYAKPPDSSQHTAFVKKLRELRAEIANHRLAREFVKSRLIGGSDAA